MTVIRFLTDEHVPGPCITALRSIGYDVLRAKDEFQEGTEDGVLLEFASETDRIVLTCDKRFTIVERDRVRTHAGVIYADQATLQCQPEDVAGAIGRIVSTVPAEEMRAAGFYVNDWM